MRVFFMVVLALGTVYIGCKLTAESQLENRLAAVRNDARNLCSSRGSAIPSEEDMEAKLAASGEAHRVEMTEIEVTIAALTPDNDTGPGANINSQFSGTLKMTGTVADAHAHMHAKKWLWHTDAELKSHCALTRELERVMPPSPGY